MDATILSQIPETLTYQDGDKVIPYRDHPFVKDAPDLPTFIKMGVDAHREVGGRIPLKVDKTNVVEIENWRKNHLGRLYDAGVLDRPPQSVTDYDDVVKRPETLPDGWGWNDEFAKDFKTISHKYGIPKAAIPELIALHEKTMTSAGAVLKTSMEAGMAALKAEHGEKYDERREGAKRLVDEIFKTPEELALFEEAGWGNHPGFIGVLMRLAPLAQADSSFFTTSGSKSGGTGALTHDEIKAEVAKIATDKTHPMHEGYMRGAPEVMAYIDGQYKKLFGAAQVEIS